MQNLSNFNMANLQFDSKPTEGRDSIVVSFDLCGFSDFCNQADAYATIPKFISSLFDELGKFQIGSLTAALLGSSMGEKYILQPDFIKFTGDGALMIWFAGTDEGFSEAFCTGLVAAMRKLQEHISERVPQWEKKWRIHSLPKGARFGIAKGLVYPLREQSVVFIPGSELDYVGYCINLAVRLQNHCPELGFLIHSPIHPNLPELVELTALEMKGTRDEPVFAFNEDLKKVSKTILAKKFLSRTS